jgi:putative heme-binding domain-containing protein
MLLWKADRAAVPPLEKMAATAGRPLARLHALCTLDGLKALKPGVLVKALGDEHPGVRRHAVRLCEGRLASAEVGAALLKRLDDADPQVRLQLACTLGEWEDERAGKGLGRLLVEAEGEPYLTAAALSSVSRKNLDAVLLAVLPGGAKAPADRGERPGQLVSRLLALASALGHDRATVTLLRAVTGPEKGGPAGWRQEALAGLLDGLEQGGSSLAKLHQSGNKEVKAAVEKTAGLFAAARAAVKDGKAEPAARVRGVRLLGRGLDRREGDLALLAGLLVPQTAADLQAAAVAALARLPEKGVPELLLRGWKGYGPGLRARVLDALLARAEWQRALLDAVERKRVPPQEVDAARRQRLLTHGNWFVRQRAAKAFAGAVDPDREKVVNAYRPALKLKGDPEKGKALFAKACATCHRLNGVGHEVGPDLAPLADRTAEYLLIAILDPNRAVEARYVNYQAELKDGRVLTGVLAAETGTSVTLLAPDGKAQVVLRANLEGLTSTGKSAMPDGLEKDFKTSELADLLAYLRAARPAAKLVPQK